MTREGPWSEIIRSTKQIQQLIRDKLNIEVCREVVRQQLHRMGMSFKKAKKLLVRANPVKRAEYMARLQVLLEEAQRGERTLVFWDPAHVRQDTDPGYGWGPRSCPLYIASRSPKRGAKVTLFGAYIYNTGQVWIKPDERANSRTVRNALFDLKNHLADAPKITVIADNANYLKNKTNHAFALRHKIEVIHIPAYSPDLMPVEELWNWFRQEVTRNTVFDNTDQIIQDMRRFVERVNTEPCKVADRLVVLEELNPDFEKLLAS